MKRFKFIILSLVFIFISVFNVPIYADDYVNADFVVFNNNEGHYFDFSTSSNSVISFKFGFDTIVPLNKFITTDGENPYFYIDISKTSFGGRLTIVYKENKYTTSMGKWVEISIKDGSVYKNGSKLNGSKYRDIYDSSASSILFSCRDNALLQLYNYDLSFNGISSSYSVFPKYNLTNGKYSLFIDDCGAMGCETSYIDGFSSGGDVALPSDKILMKFILYGENYVATSANGSENSKITVNSSNINGSISGTSLSGNIYTTDVGYSTSLELNPGLQGTNEINCKNTTNGQVCDVLQWPQYKDSLIQIPTTTDTSRVDNVKIGNKTFSFTFPQQSGNESTTSKVIYTNFAFDAKFDLRFLTRVSGVLRFDVNGVTKSTYLNQENHVNIPLGHFTNDYPDVTNFDFSLLRVENEISVKDDNLTDITENGNKDSQTSENILDNKNNELNNSFNDYDNYENQFNEDLTSSLKNIDFNKFKLDSSGLKNSSAFIQKNFNLVTNDNPFGLVLGFSLMVGLGVLFIGRKL